MTYELLDTIGKGGMATVHLARLDGRAVAVKVLHPHLADDPNAVKMFLDEARVATRIRHPNVVATSDVEMVNDDLVIVMEYVEGIALSGLLKALHAQKQKLPLDAAIRIVVDMLRGLHEAHELRDANGEPMRIVHRDVSPQNLIVGADGVSRVTDFGIATSVGRIATQTKTDGPIRGKLRYLAPEQITRKRVDRRVDIWAAGVVLWESLTGKRLWGSRGTEAETLARVLHDPVDPPSTHRPDLSIGIDDICLRALERDPERRWSTAAELADALEQESISKGVREVRALVEKAAGDEIVSRRKTFANAGAPISAEVTPARVSIGPPLDVDVDAPTLAAAGDFYPPMSHVPSRPSFSDVRSVAPSIAPASPPPRSNFLMFVVVAAVSLLLGGIVVKVTSKPSEAPPTAPVAVTPAAQPPPVPATTNSAPPETIEIGATTPAGSAPPPRRANDRRKLQPVRPTPSGTTKPYMPNEL